MSDGELDEGMRRLDEATTVALDGEARLWEPTPPAFAGGQLSACASSGCELVVFVLVAGPLGASLPRGYEVRGGRCRGTTDHAP